MESAFANHRLATLRLNNFLHLPRLWLRGYYDRDFGRGSHPPRRLFAWPVNPRDGNEVRAIEAPSIGEKTTLSDCAEMFFFDSTRAISGSGYGTPGSRIKSTGLGGRRPGSPRAGVVFICASCTASTAMRRTSSPGRGIFPQQPASRARSALTARRCS